MVDTPPHPYSSAHGMAPNQKLSPPTKPLYPNQTEPHNAAACKRKPTPNGKPRQAEA